VREYQAQRFPAIEIHYHHAKPDLYRRPFRFPIATQMELAAALFPRVAL